MKTRTLWFVVIGVVVLAAAGVAAWLGFGGTGPAWTPKEESAISMCHEEAKSYPGMSDGRLRTFAAEAVTHDGAFWRISASATADDGFGGTTNRAVQCELKVSTNNSGWEVLDLTMI